VFPAAAALPDVAVEAMRALHEEALRDRRGPERERCSS
jgi:hypothetical protein